MEYHKIQSVFKRDPSTGNKRFVMGDYSIPEFEYLASNLWVGTEKVDGTNIRLFKTGEIMGKTDNAHIPSHLLNVLRELSDRLVSSELPEDTILYGEGYGAKIQKGGSYIPDGQAFALFDVMINGNYQPRSSVEDIGSKLGLTICPVINVLTLYEWVNAIGCGNYKRSLLHPSAKNEGVVLRPEVELRTRTGDRVITKLKFKDFGL
jgi:ATP-dependent RNA circularization protein (DNA/RNA ligase family)